MPSNIDLTVPVTGNPTTASVRSNFQIAANEITALQATPPGSGIGTVNVTAPITGGGSTATVTVGLGTVPVASGGTGATTLPQANVLLGNGTNAIAAAAPGAAGTVLTSNGAGVNPTFQAGGTGTPGTPTQTIDGTVHPGTQTTFMRSDAAPALANTAVAPGGTFAYPASLTVDPQGRITAATAGPTLGPAGSVLASNGTVAAYTRDLTSLNTVTVNQNTGTLPAPYTGTLVRAAGMDTQNARVEIECFSTGSANSPQLSFRRSSGTAGTPLPPFLNAILGFTNFAGYTAAAGYQQSAAIVARASEAWSDAAQGSQLEFDTTTLGTAVTATLSTRMTIGQGVVVGGATGGTTAIVGDMGPGTVNATAYYQSGQPFTSAAADTVNPAVPAAGTTQGGATGLTATINAVTTGSGGVALPTTPTAGAHQYVRNSLTTPLSLYPASGAAINALAANAPIIVPADTTALLVAATATQWYTVP
jgi:hypothetical protein